MFLSLLTIVGIFISDLALAALDPRIRLEGKATK
jgi:peptide/nickel transport system permease protein